MTSLSMDGNATVQQARGRAGESLSEPAAVPLPAEQIQLLPLPYPYRAALAICSDLDETPDLEVYLQIMRYLNGTGATAMGPGLELEVSNSMYFYTRPGGLAYWNTDDAGREKIRQLMMTGHIDVLHSYGDLANTRAHAAEAIEELSRHGCRLEVWVDHARGPGGFGQNKERSGGDVPDSPTYHADLTTAYGIKYVWRGGLTSCVGQSKAHDLSGIANLRHPLVSTRTLAAEKARNWLGRLGCARYAMCGSNRLIQSSTLRDGAAVVEFQRFNPHWRGVSYGTDANGLADALSDRVVDRLIAGGGMSILYAQTGKIEDGRRPFNERTCGALRYLARRAHAGDILVTTTRRLLGYAEAHEHVRWTAQRCGETIILDLDSDYDLTNPAGQAWYAGLTFRLPRARSYVVRCGSLLVDHVIYQTSQESQTTVGVPWKRLKWPGV